MKNSIPWIALGFALLALAITLLHLSGYIHLKNSTEESANAIIGIIVSSAAFVVSIYFIILGINARQIKREYDEDIKKINADFKVLDNEVTKAATHTANVVYDYYSSSIAMLKTVYNNLPKMPKKNNNNEYIEKIKLARARFVCNTSDYIDDKDKKIDCIAFLGEKSRDLNDLQLLNKVIASPKSDEDVRKTASKAYRKIESQSTSISSL